MGIGWERENRKHFDEFVTAYDLARPEYPDELYADIWAFVGGHGDKRALEIGAGTGKATKVFLAAGYDVTAVEIGENMAGFLRERFQQYESFEVICDAFESVVTADASFDVIYAASAFHWVDAEIGCPKAFRLLRDGGALALFRYNHVPADGDELYEDIQDVYKEFFHRPYIRPVRISKEECVKPLELVRGFRCKDLKEYGFVDVAMRFYDAKRTFTAEEYINYLDTMADHRSLPEGDRVALYDGIKKAIIGHGGSLTVDYVFQLYLGRKITYAG